MGSSSYYVYSCAIFIDLPVEMISFTGKNSKGVNCLNWEAELIDVSHFEVQSSYDGVDFKEIGRVDAGTEQLASFEYLDKNVNQEMTYYRLKSVDLDGSIDFSKTIAVSAKVKAKLFSIKFLLSLSEQE